MRGPHPREADVSSALAYSEILDDEHKETAAAFWVSVRTYFAATASPPKGHARQRIMLWLRAIRLNPRPRRRPQEDPPLPAADQRKGGETQPHPKPGMGLRPDLPHRRGTRGDLPSLGPSLQSAPTPHRHRRQVTNRTPQRSQAAREEQLGSTNSKLADGWKRAGSAAICTTVRAARFGPQHEFDSGNRQPLSCLSPVPALTAIGHTPRTKAVKGRLSQHSDPAQAI